MPLATRKALGTISIRTQERLGGLWKYYSPEAACVVDHKRGKISPAGRLFHLKIICWDALYRQQTLMLLRI